jgi:hypothetical protein
MVKSKWLNSDAKFLLREDIIAGDVPEWMESKAVYAMRPEYAEFKYENFRTNLIHLRENVVASRARMQADCEAYGHDRGVLSVLRDLEPVGQRRLEWVESEAKPLLKRDIDEGKHHLLTPMQLYATREEYQAFPLKVFRKHIYQEIDTRSKRAARFAKKKNRARAPV